MKFESIRTFLLTLLCELDARRLQRLRRELEKYQGDIQDIKDQISVEYKRYSLVKKAEVISKKLPRTFPSQMADSKDFQNLQEIRKFVDDPDCRQRANTDFVKTELKISKRFFDTVESNPLTDEQRRAVVVDEDHNLVVAAAGSGKTSVIVSKACWLIRRELRAPSELLLLAYAKEAQKEMDERIRCHLDEDAGNPLVSTFHALGRKIISEAEGKAPSLSNVAEPARYVDDENTLEQINKNADGRSSESRKKGNPALLILLTEFVHELIQDEKYSKSIMTWFQSYFAPYPDEKEIKNMGEYWDYIRANGVLSLKGEQVKSFEECEIANFLFLNGIKYEYEFPYEYDTGTSKKRQYRPDFYLPEYGAYIEHFALSKSGRTPRFIDQEKYLESRAWKLNLHTEKGTTLIETFSHEKSDGILTENLSEKLRDWGVKMTPIPPSEVFDILNEQKRIDPFTRLIATFLQHYKEGRLSDANIDSRISKLSGPAKARAKAFWNIFKPVFGKYQMHLAARNEIDFHDMINQAVDHVENGRGRKAYHSYRYILVDEFQDISSGQARLLAALLKQSDDAQLFAVGDDWQSIYRFAGADVAIMLGFQERFVGNERIDLSTTFRCAEPIATAATKFILENKDQLRKEVHSSRKSTLPCLNIGFPEPGKPTILEESLQSIAADFTSSSPKSDARASVLILGRYRHLRPDNLNRLAKGYPSLDISYMTIHQSKGREADYVILVGLSSGKYGFPTEIVDDPILDVVLPQPDGHKNAEERRLFYVAVTRAKHQVFLLADSHHPSPFITELLNGEYEVKVFGRSPHAETNCPACVGGRLKSRESEHRTFYGCSNYPYCSYTQNPCPICSTGLPMQADGMHTCNECGENFESCPKCGNGYLLERNGPYGPFLGCSNWPECNCTRNL